MDKLSPVKTAKLLTTASKIKRGSKLDLSDFINLNLNISMLQSLNGFDPLLFLEINTSEISNEEQEELKRHLNQKIGEYVLIKLSDQFSPEVMDQVTQASSGEDMLGILSKSEPNLEENIIKEVENFKKDYNKWL